MDIKLRPSGIEGLGDMPWGTHFCMFYQTKDDLLDILIPYFKAGLENNEFFLYVASPPLSTEEAKQAMQEAVPDFERYLSQGQIEIVSYRDWLLTGGQLDTQRVLQNWIDKLNWVLAKGYAGLRFVGDPSWLDKQAWGGVPEFEKQLDQIVGNSQMRGLCAYALERCSAADVLDVVHQHQFTVAKRNGVWEHLEGLKLKRAHEEVLKLNNELEQRVMQRTTELTSINEQLRAEIVERQRVETELSYHAYLLENLHDAIIATDEKFVITSWNRAAEEMYGWTAGEVIGENVQPVIHSEFTDVQREEALGFLHKGEHFHTEVLQYHRYGKPIWVEGNVITLRDSTGEVIGFVSVNRDITERKRMEEALRESEEKFSAAFRASPIGLVIATLDGKYVEVNQALCDLLGYSREELLGKTAVEVGIFSADTRQAWVEALEREEGAMTNRELSFQLRNGISRTTLSSVETITLHGIPHRLSTVLDITERKRAEEEIRRYVTRMEVLAEISRTFVEVGLDYQSVLNTVARRTAELIGDSCVITLFSDDAQRSFPVAFHHPNPVALSLMQEALLHTWQGGTDTQRYQTLLAGNSIYIPSVNPEEFRASLEPEFRTYFEAVGISSVLIVPLKTHSRVIGTLGITRDHQGNPYTREDLTLLQNIADRAAISIQNAQLFRQVEGAREQLGALSRRLLEVQESERRALTTELHDRVGQNLTGLSINLQNLKALLSDEMAKTLATKFDDAQTLVEHTTRQIRDIMAELHPPELEDYGLAVALETYAERAASRGNLELIADLPDLAPPPLPSDVSIALFRAAQEAISNVIKHANATQLEVSLEERDDRIRLRVGDDGRGFEPDAASQKEVQTWGLKIMRERIESIGGKVQIESERGEGTRVIFEIERPS